MSKRTARFMITIRFIDRDGDRNIAMWFLTNNEMKDINQFIKDMGHSFSDYEITDIEKVLYE